MSQALSQAIHQILSTHPDGLTEREVRWAVIEGLGLRCTPREVREVLHTHPDLFVPLAGGVWRSKAAVEAEKVAANVEEVPRELGEALRACPKNTCSDDFSRCSVTFTRLALIQIRSEPARRAGLRGRGFSGRADGRPALSAPLGADFNRWLPWPPRHSNPSIFLTLR